MNDLSDIHQMHDKIRLMKRTALELMGMGDEFPAIVRNTDRILASIKMLEMNISDLAELE